VGGLSGGVWIKTCGPREASVRGHVRGAGGMQWGYGDAARTGESPRRVGRVTA